MFFYFQAGKVALRLECEFLGLTLNRFVRVRVELIWYHIHFHAAFNISCVRLWYWYPIWPEKQYIQQQGRGHATESDHMRPVTLRSPDFCCLGFAWMLLRDVPVLCIRVVPFSLLYLPFLLNILLYLLSFDTCVCIESLLAREDLYFHSEVFSGLFSLKAY